MGRLWLLLPAVVAAAVLALYTYNPYHRGFSLDGHPDPLEGLWDDTGDVVPFTVSVSDEKLAYVEGRDSRQLPPAAILTCQHRVVLTRPLCACTVL